MTAPCGWAEAGRAWRSFFFEPRDTLPCDVVRIGYAAVILLTCLLGIPYVRMWYGETGVLPFDLSRELIDPDTWTVFSLLPRTDSATYACYGILTIQSLLLLVGFWSSFQAVCVFIWVISFQHRNLMILDAEDAVIRVMGFLLIFMPLGQAIGWDAWRRRRIQKPVEIIRRPLWGLRLLQIETCVIFLGAALSKLRSEDWLDGTALYYASRLDDYFFRFPLPTFPWESLAILKWLGWAVIAIELAVPILVWLRETRWPALIAAGLLHLAMEYSMNLFMFHWLMLVAWSSFITGEEWRWLGRRLFGARVMSHCGQA